MKKLAIVITHPIQYYIPIFQLLTQLADLKVFYTWGEASVEKYDPGFGKIIEWDIPLLSDYNYTFEQNTARKPGSHHFSGIKTPELLKNILDFNPDAILVFGWAYYSHLKVIRYFHGKKPIWFRGDSTLMDQQCGFKNVLRSVFLKWVYKHIDIAFYVGEQNKAYFLKYGLKPDQLLLAPHAVDNERFAKGRIEEVKEFRNHLVLKENDVLILFAGKLESKKNPMLLLEAFLEMEAVNAHLLYVGNGVLEEELKTAIKKWKMEDEISNPAIMGKRNNLTDRVHFMDFQNQTYMPVIYQSCDIFCLPSQGPAETWGLAINEAMACGKAIIVSDKVGCAVDLVNDGENGFVFEHNSKENLINKLNLLITEPKKINTFGMKSKEIIENYTFTSIVKPIIQELEKKNGPTA